MTLTDDQKQKIVGSTPLRLRLSRQRGFDLQLVSRATNGLSAVNCARPGRWGNPYKIGDPVRDGITGPVTGHMTAMEVVDKFRRRECTNDRSSMIVGQLAGRNLACWCALCPAHSAGKPLGIVCNDCAPCHTDVLLEIANLSLGKNP